MEIEEHPSVKVDGEDSNAVILLGRKRNKNKKKEKKDKVSKKLKPISNHKLSKSQNRKLKKLEEEKAKADLFSKSIEDLEKYKIRDEVYSLMWSSRNLGQVETVREKRQRETQYLKAGLDLPQSDQPFKKRAIDNTLTEMEHDNDGTHTNQAVSDYESTQVKRENLSNICASSGSSEEVKKSGASSDDNDIPAKEVANENTESLIPERLQMHLSVCRYNNSKTRKLKVNADENQKFDDRILSMQAVSPSERALSEVCQKEQPQSTQPAAVYASRREDDENQEANLNSTSTLTKSLRERTLATPTVVHVSRPEAVENQRKNLPIVMMEQEIMEAINERTSVIICGETGCGKTTQVPQFLYEAGFGSRDSNVRGGIIGVTQPRRVAVLATAKRVAFELGLHLGKEVGFQVRHDKKIGDNCSIKFMTDGILLREVQSDFLLKHYSIIILDEAHERSLNTDILIGMLSRVIKSRQIEYEKQQKKLLSGEHIEPENRIYPLKLVLMSATLRVEDFILGGRIFHVPPPVIEVPTRQYPVTIHFSKRTELIDYVGQTYRKVLSIHKRLPAGGILVFVTGQREVEYLCRKLRKASRHINEEVSRGHNELASVSGENSAEDSDIKEINEAFEIQQNSGHEVTGRLNSYEEHEDLSESESDFSEDLEYDSDLEVSLDNEDSLNERSFDSDGKLLNLMQEGGNLESLKAAFEALDGKRTSNPHSEGKNVPLVSPEDGSNNFISGKTMKVTNASAAGPMCVLPLYAMLPASAQLRVFEEVKEGERLVVVATNVAETSLTIPGIKYVVDTGKEKCKNFNPSNGMETYEIKWISKASAAQRAGRAGRTAPGHCYRLYSSAAFGKFPDFSSAEISKVPVDGVVLLMKSMHIDKVANFPFPTPPKADAILEAEHCLKVLEALDIKGQLTPLGKAMARYPMSPRHSRMLLTVIQIMQNMKGYARANLVLGYAVAVAAALSFQHPFDEKDERDQDDKSGTVQNEKASDKEEKLKRKKLKEKAKLSRAKFSNPTSDALTTAYALQCFESSGDPVEFCSDNALHLKTMEEMSKLRKQLLQLVFSSNFSDLQREFLWTQGGVDDIENAWRVSTDKNPLLLNEEEILGQAICAGWADRVAKRIKGIAGLSEGDRKVNAVRYQACMVKETVFLHRWSSLSKSAPEFLVYSELLETKRPYIRRATHVKSDWFVKYAHPMCSFSSPHSDPKPFYDPVTDQVFCWVTPNFGPHNWQLPLHSIPIKDDIDRVAVFAYSLLEGQVLPCLKSVRKFLAASPASILRPEALGVKRVGNLLNKLKCRRRVIDSCSMLKKLWEDYPRELFVEIQDWFQGGFHNQLEELWTEMHREVLLDPKDRFPRKLRKQKQENVMILGC